MLLPKVQAREGAARSSQALAVTEPELATVQTLLEKMLPDDLKFLLGLSMYETGQPLYMLPFQIRIEYGWMCMADRGRYRVVR